MALSQNNLKADVKADLYSQLLAGFTCQLLGESAIGDTPIRWYDGDGSSTATDDGENVIQPTGIVGAGRWIKRESQQIQADWNAATGQGVIANKPTIPAAQIQSDWNQNNSASADFIKNKPSLPSAPSEAVVSRALNNTFQPSATNAVLVYYSFSISVTSTLLGTNSGTVSLQTSTHGSGSWTTKSQIGLSISGVVSTEIIYAVLSGFVAPGLDVRLLTAVAGANGATFTYITGQEVTL